MLNNQYLSDNTPNPLTKEELEGITDFIMALKDLVDDVLDQGYTIEDGKLIPPSERNRP